MPAVSNAHVTRLFDMLIQHGVASRRAPLVETLRGDPPKPALELARAAAEVLARAFAA